MHFDEDAWDDLLNYIEERRVIPIIGPELLRVQTDQGLQPLHHWLAEKLAARLSIDAQILPQPPTLNDVVWAYRSQRGRREEAYTRLRSILREVEFEPPLALRQLAQITDFDLFVTTTFDSLLERAINLERHGGETATEIIAFAPNRIADLPMERSHGHTCSAAYRPRQPMSSRTRTCWNSSARCNPSIWRPKNCSTSSNTITCW